MPAAFTALALDRSGHVCRCHVQAATLEEQRRCYHRGTWRLLDTPLFLQDVPVARMGRNKEEVTTCGQYTHVTPE